MNHKELIQNLKDAGCQSDIIEVCLESFKNEDFLKIYHLLQKYRQNLLDDLHICQKKMDCLDYLLFQIEKSGEL